MSIPFQGYFINLDRNADRRARIEDQLQRLGLSESYERVAAFDGHTLPAKPEKISRGEYGCFASHVEALSQGSLTGRHLHIVEDDVLLSPRFLPALSGLEAQGVFNQVDLLFTDVGFRPDSMTVRALDRVVGDAGPDPKSAPPPVRLLDLNSLDWACSSSYLVAGRAVERLKQALAADLRTTPQLPLDLRLRTLVKAGQFRAAVCLPFLTSVALDLDVHSSVREPDTSRIACNIIRQYFYIDADVSVLESALRKHCAVGALDRRRRTMLDAVAFTMFGDFRMP
ncbi:MAG TPA: glycosyltransferase family 25 protein [Steroidobacteraceae bacterium]|nr:glycosyltransferase family 25 protein [Steroidobacteraceae bacterium]